MTREITKFIKDEEGVTMVEYGLLLALIAIFLIIAVTFMRDQLAAFFTAVGNLLAGAI